MENTTEEAFKDAIMNAVECFIIPEKDVNGIMIDFAVFLIQRATD